MKIVLNRPKTGTKLEVKPPIQLAPFKHLPQRVATYLNSWVDYQYPGFEIFGFIEK
jgi:hypothetical protein